MRDCFVLIFSLCFLEGEGKQEFLCFDLQFAETRYGKQKVVATGIKSCENCQVG